MNYRLIDLVLCMELVRYNGGTTFALKAFAAQFAKKMVKAQRPLAKQVGQLAPQKLIKWLDLMSAGYIEDHHKELEVVRQNQQRRLDEIRQKSRAPEPPPIILPFPEVQFDEPVTGTIRTVGAFPLPPAEYARRVPAVVGKQSERTRDSRGRFAKRAEQPAVFIDVSYSATQELGAARNQSLDREPSATV